MPNLTHIRGYFQVLMLGIIRFALTTSGITSGSLSVEVLSVDYL